MQQLLDTKQDERLAQAVIFTLAFFSLYELPISSKRLHELLLGHHAEPNEVETILETLAQNGRVQRSGGLYSLKSWNAAAYQTRQLELAKKWETIDRYFPWLAILPFVRGMSVINSLAMGTADADSDIDFFVITENRRLYFVRSMIIVLFRLLGVYKTRQKIKDRFCFGFFVTQDHLSLKHLLLQPEDPYFVFWLANMRPIFGGQYFWKLMQNNQWLTNHFPNFQPMLRLSSAKQPSFFIKSIKLALEILLWLPSLLVEPLLRHIHIKHTFKLAENNTVTSTTIANAKMLKLHGYDVRAEVAAQYSEVLKNFG